MSITVSFTALIAFWYLLVWITDLPAFILPSPLQVWNSFVKVLTDGRLAHHFYITLREVLVGLAFGAGSAVVLGYLLAKSKRLESILAPYIVASQSVPMVAIAPLLVIWFGSGMLSKVLICALIVFFPILINTIVGIRSVPAPLYELMQTLNASRWQIFTKLEIPAALPIIFGGLRIGVTLSVIGAVVGEFVGADQGLGFLINLARGQYDTALVFVAVATLVFMASALYGVIVLLENRFLAWQSRGQAANSRKL